MWPIVLVKQDISVTLVTIKLDVNLSNAKHTMTVRTKKYATCIDVE
jgi:hypothetical protein